MTTYAITIDHWPRAPTIPGRQLYTQGFRRARLRFHKEMIVPAAIILIVTVITHPPFAATNPTMIFAVLSL